jgi:glycosyltransferase involved in cell wall biosynthesis
MGVLAGAAPPGDEIYEREMRELWEARALGGRLRWLGNLDAIEPFMQGIDIFVSTSGHETFGMSICEAMACGRPVVAYRAGSAGEVVGAAGIVAETADLEALTSGVERLIVDPSLRRTLGDQARARVASTFDPRVSLAELGAVYRSVAETRSSGRRG